MDELSTKQLEAIPHLAAAGTVSEGCLKAGISRKTYYEWMTGHRFADELTWAKDALGDEVYEGLKGQLVRATQVLLELLDSKNEVMRRHVANDIIGHMYTARAIKEMEKRLDFHEHIEQERTAAQNPEVVKMARMPDLEFP